MWCCTVVMSKMIVNIRGYTQSNIDDDIAWRYKMRGVVLVKSGDMLIFKNVDEICKDLNRDKKMLVQFLNKELATSFQYKKDDLCVKKADLSTKMLQDCVYKFIDYCVNCYVCKSPDTKLLVLPTRKKIGEITCDSCGKTSPFM